MSHENFLFANFVPLPVCCCSDPDTFAVTVADGTRISSRDDHAVGFRIIRATRRY
jgi:hypothetical protein